MSTLRTGLFVISLSFGLLLLPVETNAQARVDTTTQDSISYTPDYETKPGTELVAVYVGAEWCGPCKLPNVKQAITRMKTLLDEKASRRGWSFATMGVSLDWKVDAGYNFLQRNGSWDEVVIGKNWTNLGASRFIWADSTAKPAMPQVILLRRKVHVGKRMEMTEYHLLGRHVGSDEIPHWVDQGAPLPEEE